MEFYALKLKDELVVRSSSNPSYSLRAFARDLKLSPSFLSGLLKGNKKLSAESLSIISQKLGWSFDSELEFKEADQIRNLTWIHIALIELSQSKKLKNDVNQIAKILGTTKKATQLAVELLVERNLLKVENDGLISLPNKMMFGSNTTSQEIRRFHKEFMQLAQLRMEQCDYDQRELSSTVIALSPDQVQSLRANIRTFIGDLGKHTKDKSEDKELFGLAIQMFPITQTQNINQSKTQNTKQNKNKENKNV